MGDSRYSSRRWQALRLAVLNRDGWRCTINHPECKYAESGSLHRKPRAAHVHHVHPPVLGGSFWDASNLVSVCAMYNIAERNLRWNTRIASPPSPSRNW